MSGCYPRFLPPDELRRALRAESVDGDVSQNAGAFTLPLEDRDEPTGSRPRPELQAAIDAFFDGQETSFATKTAA